MLGVLEMNSAEMEYNMSRHPELYHMDVFGVIRLNEEEYEKQQEMNNMMTNKTTMIIRAKGDSPSFDTEIDKQSALSTLATKYPNVAIVIADNWNMIDATDIKAAEDEHTQYVLTQI